MMTAGGLRALTEERDHLLRSIEDLDAERAAGEVSEDDYQQLRASYVARAADVLRAIDAAGGTSDGVAVPAQSGDAGRGVPAGTAGPAGHTGSRLGRFRRALGRRTTRRWLGACLVVCFVGIVALLALRIAGVRLPGEGVSGGVTVNGAQQIRLDLNQAQALGAAGQVREALVLYQDVLAIDPSQPEALAYRGWLVRLTGLDIHSSPLIATGRASIEEALAVDPHYGDAHFFLGLMLLEDYGNLRGAVAQFDAALSDDVSHSLIVATRPIIEKAFRTAHDTVPAAVAGA
jgi:tetratricopeptide (TPR) repeat protein